MQNRSITYIHMQQLFILIMRPVFINHKYIGRWYLQSWYVLEQVVEISKTEETLNWEVLICQGFMWQVIPTYLSISVWLDYLGIRIKFLMGTYQHQQKYKSYIIYSRYYQLLILTVRTPSNINLTRLCRLYVVWSI